MDYSDVASSSVPLSDAFEFIAQSHLTPSSSSGPFQILPRPRILVCAPSNAAVDEIVGRLAVERLLDGNGLPYTPDIVRIGRPSSIRDGAVKDNISLDHLVDAFFRYSPAQLKERMILVDQHRKRVGMNLKKMQDYVLHVRATSTPCDLNALAVQITSFAEERYRIGLEYQRLEMVRDNRKEVANARLQESFLDQAQIVFSTLSGTQSRFLAGSGSQRGFDVCIIDECAQCVEASTLLPLVGYGDIRVVILVGDPRQLPATVFMTGNRARIYQRSMFQRLQEAGLPSIMLTQQYRMHPEIRQFPSRYFYSNSLRDGGQTLLYSPDYYTDRRFGPYLFFDLTGRELRQRSVRNATEAAFIAQHIDALITSFPAVNPNTIAVVTPYLSQVACVKGALRSLTPPLDDVVEVTTIDSFQGREKDIVLFSCVRSGSGEIGFVKDVRRMNVGITRARHAMWIVGNAATLQLSKPWAALIDDARRRKLYISS
uniref:DNA2/NAM7 helicase-like C-terminal domain-containing protein n=1 Tax=Spongospora subterranea TaxID=70186 RepID=A0A0H5QRD3_9EUKA|eukprot:CRZ04610.1 hypothetical protein [Spongospora subterranea]